MTTAQSRQATEACYGRTRLLFGLQLTLALAVVLTLMLIRTVEAAPYRPADDSEILERLPATGEAGETAAWRQALAADPNDLALALTVARADYRRGLAESDPRFLGYAEAALAPWWDRPSPPVEVLVLRGLLKQRRHDFTGALADLDRALTERPNHPQALLTRATVLRLLGRHDDALASCRRLPRTVPALIRTSCQAAVRSLSGDLASAEQNLQAVLRRQGASAGLVWAYTLLGEIAVQRGNSKAAEAAFRQALEQAPDDGYLLAAMADLLLAEGRAKSARWLLDGRTRADALLLRLALAEAALGGPREATFRRDLAARFAAGDRRGESGHEREEARFALDLLDQPRVALDLALANWEIQKEPADARLLLRAALAAGRPLAAGPVRAWIAQTGLQDAQSEALAAQLDGLAER